MQGINSKGSDNKKRIPNHVRFMIAGIGGMTAALIVHPLDLLKVRMQLSGEGGASRDHKTSLHAVRSVVKNEGLLGLYAGISANLVRQGTYATVRMGTFQSSVELMEKHGYKGLVPQLGAGTLAGVVGVMISTPTDVVLVRMMSDARLPPAERRAYKNVFHAYLRIWKEEGIKGLYTGLKPSMMKSVASNTSQLVSYVQAKSFLIRKGYMEDNIKCHLVSSFISGIIFALSTCPFDVLKTRMQQMNTRSGRPGYSNLVDGVSKIVREEGPTGLWKGFIPLYFRAAPFTILFFIVIEQLTSLYNERILRI